MKHNYTFSHGVLRERKTENKKKADFLKQNLGKQWKTRKPKKKTRAKNNKNRAPTGTLSTWHVEALRGTMWDARTLPTVYVAAPPQGIPVN